MAKSSLQKGISRLDQPARGTHGWYVRVQFRSKRMSKFFSDSKFGGRGEALEAAVTWRNAAEKALGKPRTDRRVVGRGQPDKKEKNTLPTGVRRRVKTSRGYPSEVYEVTWAPEPNRIARTSVSIRRYGEEEAYKRALKIRREKEMKLYGKVL